MEWKRVAERLRDGEKVYDDGFDVDIDSSKPNIYLAGPVSDYSAWNRVRSEALDASEGLPTVNMVDPLKSEPTGRDEIAPHDLQLLKECDGVIAYYVKETESWGTAGELYTAAMLDMPIILWVLEKPKHGRYSPWLESVISGKKNQFRPAVHRVVGMV